MTGERLKQLLKSNNVQLNELAAKLGISQQNMSNRLRVDDVSSGFLEKIAGVLGVKMDWFWGDEEKPINLDEASAVRELASARKELEEARKKLGEKDADIHKLIDTISNLTKKSESKDVLFG